MFPGWSWDFSLQLVHQRSGQSLLAVVSEEGLQRSVLGQTEQRGNSAGLSGCERLLEDHPALDCGEGPELLEDLSLVLLPTIQDKD